MRIQGAILAGLLAVVLVGCTSPSPSPEPTPTSPATPEIEVAPIGEAAIPLGCSDILAVADVADLGPSSDEKLTLAIDENRIAVDLTVADLQIGALRCGWASRYGSTDFHAIVDLRIIPSAAVELDAADEEAPFGTEFVAADGVDDTLVACIDSFTASDSDPTLFNQCTLIQLRAGYRIELFTSALRASAGNDPRVALELLAKVDAAVDDAGPARKVNPVGGAADPASLCGAPEILPVLEYLGASGPPNVEPSGEFPDVLICTWSTEDEYGNPAGPWITVFPGGAWAIPRLGTGVANIFVPTHPSADGSFVIGVGDGVSAWRAVGDDLVYIVSGDYAAVAGWEAFLEATW